MSVQPSLRRVFLRVVAVPLLLCSIVIWSAGLLYTYHEVEEVYDATLAQFAREINQLIEQGSFAEGQTVIAGAAEVHHKYERKIAFRVLRQGREVAHSAFPDPGESFPGAGYYDRVIAGEKWRFFVLSPRGSDRTIEVAEEYAIRYEMILQLLGSMIVPATLFLAAVLGIVWWGATYSLRRLVALSTQVDARAVDDMTPIDDAAIPREVRPLLNALNRLFARVSEGFRREKEFTDNAAHELRTPLAAIKTQAQVIERSERLSESGRAGLGNLLSAIDRAAAMVDALLAFARVQADRSGMQAVDFSAIVQQELEDLLRYSGWRGRRIERDILPGITLRGSAQGLAILVRNILSNALKFTPESGGVSVALGRGAGGVVLRVSDTGPGIPDPLKDKVFERFFKGSKSQSGSGLGLALVKSVADIHGARISLGDNQPSGLRFEVMFPLEIPRTPA